MMATDELASKLAKRSDIIEKDEEGLAPDMPSMKVWNPYTEFKEFSRKQIQNYQKMFNQYDVGKDKFIDFMELKMMMEKLGCPQTHLALKEMIREVDEDHDNKISFREFLLIFRKAAAGELSEDSGLYQIYQQLEEVDVDKEGVKGAKNFFEAKIDQQTQSNKFEAEIRAEQEEKRKELEEKKIRRAAFKDKANMFQE
jgi:Ca2+-binding EF-hand superfamily protein